MRLPRPELFTKAFNEVSSVCTWHLHLQSTARASFGYAVLFPTCLQHARIHAAYTFNNPEGFRCQVQANAMLRVRPIHLTFGLVSL
jgi:hypothetical protein